MNLDVIEDLKMTILEDLAEANRNILRDALPNFDTKVEVVPFPEPHLKISFGEVKNAADYPRIVTAKAVLFPTARKVTQ